MARFDLNLLGALDALVTERNVTRAAERLNVTQPTMSGMLQRLRFQFDDELLVRVGRGMELTPLGQSLVEPVRQALRGVEALVHVEPVFEPRTSTRSFSIMASDYCALTFLPVLLRRLAISAPAVRVAIKPLAHPIDRLLSGEIDLLISHDDRSLFGQRGGAEILDCEVLFSDHFVCVAAKDHPICSPTTLETYLRYPHVGVQMDGRLESLEAIALKQHAPGYQPAYTVSEFSAVPHMVAGSTMIGVIQHRLARIAARSLSIRMFDPPFDIPRITEAMFWHPRQTMEPAHAWLRHAVTDEAARWLQ